MHKPVSQARLMPSWESKSFLTLTISRAAIVLNPKIKKYKFTEVKNIIDCEYPIDEPVTDTKMSALCLASTLPDEGSMKDKNQQMMEIILEKNPMINY